MSSAVPRKRLTAAARRDQIVRTAMGLFARSGFEGTTTRAIAAGAGVSEALLYRFFPDKEALYAAIIDRKVRESSSGLLPEEAAARGDDREVLGFLARGVLRRMRSDTGFTRLLLYSGLERHALATRFYRKRIRVLCDFLEGYVRRRIAAGAFRRVDPAIAARAFFGMVCNHALMRELFPGERRARFRDERFVEAVVEVALGGLAAVAGKDGS